jgi:hypothetical protein
MKKIISVLLILISVHVRAQDSVKITITPQCRDVEYISSLIYMEYDGQELFDSIKAKMRVQNPPTGLTTVSLTGYTQDWLAVYTKLNNDAIAIKGGIKLRVETLLRAINQAYLTSRLDAFDAADAATIITMRTVGRNKSRRL